MAVAGDPSVEESLDPQDWSSMRALGHRMLDDMITHLETIECRPVWQPIPDHVKARLRQPLPQNPQAIEEIYEDFLELILPYPMGNIHPRFWGWAIGTGTPSGMLAEMLSSTLNSVPGGGEQVPNDVELQVLDWCKEMLNFPLGASGLLVSGCSTANLVGLTVARNTTAGFDIRQEGLQASRYGMAFYCSTETHSSIQKAVELLGLGAEYLRQIPVNEEFQIDLTALQRAIAEDRRTGYKPTCIVGNAGTINTGAFDDLDSLADICEREGMWFHVDGAFGAWAALSPQLHPLVAGMGRADSLACDMHKWMYMPYEIACVLVRSAEAHRRSFSLMPDYLEHHTRGLAGGKVWFTDYGIQLSRSFRALKAWMSLKEHGVEKYGRLIQQNVDQARYLAELVDSSPELEMLAPVPLNTVCFRFRADDLDDPSLNRLNEELMIRLQEQGKVLISYTTLNGKYALRAGITNHRSRREDFDLLVQEVTRVGQELLAERFLPTE
jgi:aromatic-L-amino-acid decarboxylase